jgi:hypothetical protein
MERGLSGRAVVRINAALTPESQPNPEHSKQLVEDRDLKTTPPGEPKGKTVYLTGGEVDKTSVSLRFSSDTLDPDEISNLLDCRPTHSYRKGDVLPDRYGRIAKKSEVAQTGMWRLRGKKTDKISLENQIFELFSRLSDDLEIWRKLTSQYHSDLFCGLFMESWNRGIDFSPELMAQISARGLTLSLDIYYVETRLIPVEPNFPGPSSGIDE